MMKVLWFLKYKQLIHSRIYCNQSLLIIMSQLVTEVCFYLYFMNHKTSQPSNTVTKQPSMKYSPKSVSKEPTESFESIPLMTVERDESIKPFDPLKMTFTPQYVQQLRRHFEQRHRVLDELMRANERYHQEDEEKQQRRRNAPSIFKKTIGVFKNWFSNTKKSGVEVCMMSEHHLDQDHQGKKCELTMPKNSQAKNPSKKSDL